VSTYDFSLAKTYFHISPEGTDHLYDEMPATGLLDPIRLGEMLRKTGELVKATDGKLPGSFFGTTLCHLMLTKLVFVSLYGKVLELTLERLTFQVEQEEGHDHPHLGYRIDEVRELDIPSEGGEAFVLDDWRKFVSEAVAPAVESIAEASGMKPEMIWGQFGGVGALVKGFVDNTPFPAEVKERFHRHYRIMTEEIAPDVYRARRNPFACRPRFTESPYRPGEQWMIRSACCFYDRRENGEKCYVCPKLTEDERAAMKARIQAEAG